jgi:hypothetical protein
VKAFFSDIYFIDFRKLGAALRSGGISELQALKHFCLATALFSADRAIPSTVTCTEDPTVSGWATSLIIWLSLAATHFWGMFRLSAINRTQSLPLFKTLACLYLPASVIYFIASILFAFILTPLFYWGLGKVEFSGFLSALLTWALAVCATVLFYLLVGYMLREIQENGSVQPVI